MKKKFFIIMLRNTLKYIVIVLEISKQNELVEHC